MKKKITIDFTYFDDPALPEDQRWIAVIEKGEYKATVDAGSSIPDCLREIATSIEVLDEYRKKIR